MSTADIARAFVIHLGSGAPELVRLADEACERGMRVIELDLQGLVDRSALVDYLAKAFMFPHEIVGLDAAVDLISDLEWFGNSRGYLVIARGVVGTTAVGETFVSILPNIVDRWRSQRVPFVVAIDGEDERLQSVLASANREMERAGKLACAQPGTGPTEVVLHRGNGPRGAAG
ncbi:barstar family protein [Aestuariimicrobium kwangyangense]|uniref:barstar family protein n=1 Tax=Aestuariimicrobium kwangyangense TaxID=396389 RepID=UPI0003B7607B|nr:hypothetical protein [Aestuariimicrobium kwangyangense]